MNISEAIAEIKKNAKAKFDESVEAHIEGFNSLLQIFGHVVLISGIGMDRVPRAAMMLGLFRHLI